MTGVRITFIAGACLFAAQLVNAESLGTYGRTYPIKERDAISAMKDAVRKKLANGGKEAMLRGAQERYMASLNNVATPAGIRPARSNAVRLVDLTETVKETITNGNGVVVVAAGTKINPLVPVLKSPWLMFHVAVIVGAYGFFGISCLIGLTNLVMMSVSGEKNSVMLKERVRELSIVNEMSLWIGLALMTIGTFLGAVWANESWGRYWGWDPKETWALITMVIYAIVTHLRLIPKCNNLWLFNFTSILAFYSVLMTFFGVNYFLSGMHSYGQNDNVNGIFIYLYLSIILVLGAGFISYRKRTNFNNIIV